MKPGKLCKKTGKRAFGSYEEAIRKGVTIFAAKMNESFRAYTCPFCKCWHLTTH